MSRGGYDYDWLVVGSGFGGSVSALRLAQKGYSVGVLECGRRYRDDELARSAWDLRRYYWWPRLGLHGTLRMTVFKDMAILSGSGVGGGSLVYSAVHYRPPESFFSDPQWAGLEDWQSTLAPHYDEVERMLGHLRLPARDRRRRAAAGHRSRGWLRRELSHLARGRVPGRAGQARARPLLRGRGPARAAAASPRARA